jgi:hypothetical protein
MVHYDNTEKQRKEARKGAPYWMDEWSNNRQETLYQRERQQLQLSFFLDW